MPCHGLGTNVYVNSVPVLLKTVRAFHVYPQDIDTTCVSPIPNRETKPFFATHCFECLTRQFPVLSSPGKRPDGTENLFFNSATSDPAAPPERGAEGKRTAFEGHPSTSRDISRGGSTRRIVSRHAHHIASAGHQVAALEASGVNFVHESTTRRTWDLELTRECVGGGG